MTLITILQDNTMEQKMMTAEVLKARIEAMKKSNNPLMQRIARMMEKKFNSMKSEE